MKVAPLSVNAFAKRLGVDEAAVRKAIRTGRLSESLAVDDQGKPKIADVDLAEREWRDNADPSKGPTGGFGASKNGHGSTTAEERRKLIRAQRRKVELEYAKRRGALISAVEAETLWATRVVEARTKLLGHTSRAKQRLPHLTSGDLAVLDELIREALEALAGEKNDN